MLDKCRIFVPAFLSVACLGLLVYVAYQHLEDDSLGTESSEKTHGKLLTEETKRSADGGLPMHYVNKNNNSNKWMPAETQGNDIKSFSGAEEYNDLYNSGSEDEAKHKAQDIIHKYGDSKSSPMCISSQCFKVSRHIRLSLDTKVDPCYNFYKFACGGWKKKNPIPESYNDYSTFTKLSKIVENQIHGILIEPESDIDDHESLIKAKKLYKSCMDVNEIDRRGNKPVLEFIKKIGSWSLNKEEWDETKWDVREILKQLHANYYPASPFFSIEVTNDHTNSRKHLIKIEQAGISLQREIYFKKPKLVKIYKTYMTKVFKMLGVGSWKKSKSKVKQLMDLETRIARFTTTAEAKAAGIYQRMTIAKLSELTRPFDWLSHLRAVFPKANLQSHDVVLATDPNYLHKIITLMDTTPKDLLSNYVAWQMIRDKISLLSSKFRDARAWFNRKVSGVTEVEKRWRTCTSVTNSNLGVPIGTKYVKKYFDEMTKEKTLAMIKEIIKAFEERVSGHDWIDQPTTRAVIEKADSVESKVGYASYVVDPFELEKRFGMLQISRDDFFDNNLNIDRWVRFRVNKKLRKPVDGKKWPMFPQTINAMYQFYENNIVIPAAILKAPFYYTGDVPRSLSYGAIGSMIGHELTHGFDNTGRKFDKHGNIVGEWWTQSSVNNFNKNAYCIQLQYGKYKIQNKYPVSGVLTLGENIADNGGAKISHHAYQKFLEANGEEPRLPELDYTNEQLFFIGYAQEYCMNSRPSTEALATYSEIHAPPQFRVIGTLSNMDSFAKAFQCSAGSKMNPTTKCEVW